METVCYIHPNAQAVGRCVCCGRALCQKCMVYSHGSVYCSSDCADKQKMLGDELHRKLEAKRQGSFFRALGGLVVATAIALFLLQLLGLIQIKDWIGM